MATYDLSSLVLSPANDEPMTIGEGDKRREMTVRDAIVTAFKMPVGQQEQVSMDDINKRRKIVTKLTKAENLQEISLKADSVTAIKEQIRKYYIPGIVMQICEVFDGELTQAQLDEV